VIFSLTSSDYKEYRQHGGLSTSHSINRSGAFLPRVISLLPNMKLTSFLTLLPLALAAPAQVQKRAAPTVIAPSPQATVSGKNLLGVETFNGIPYAQPPVGQLRLKPPQPITSAVGKVDGTASPKGCPQMFFSTGDLNFPTNVLGTLLNTPLFQAVQNSGEDCLTINVQRPTGTKADAKLPVLFWIFGKSFQHKAFAISQNYYREGLQRTLEVILI
jgi:hypothetical protein